MKLRAKSSPPMWVREKTAPAIPNTNYGYKQTPEGNLEPDIPERSSVSCRIKSIERDEIR